MPEVHGRTGDLRSLVVVLSYRGPADTLACVASLVAEAPAHAVLVVDNGSDDGVLDAVAARWPDVATLQAGSNTGFAGGMNRGLAWARERGYDVVTVLNNDTLVAPGALDELAARAAGGRVAVSPVVRYRDGGAVWFAGGAHDPDDALPAHLPEQGVAALRGPDPDAPYATELLAGCCVTASAATWAEVGGFDERFFLNFEDSEWSVRATRAGVRLEVVPAATVLHRVSASFVGAYSYLGTFYYTRNALLYAALAAPAAGRGWRRALRLARRRLLPVPVRAARADGVREGVRRGVMVATGLGAHVVRRYGRAPRWVEQAAARWSQAPSGAGEAARATAGGSVSPG